MSVERGGKSALRAMLRARLAEITPEQAEAWSGSICKTLAGLDELGGAGLVLSYWPMRGEVDVRPVHEVIARRGGGICLPRVDWEKGTIEAARAEGLVESRHGVWQPGDEAAAVDPEEIGAVLVPGVGFDERGGRLGRGAGFYDRLLACIDARVPRVGVCFDVQIVEEVPIERHDVRVSVVVTERRVMRPR